MNAIIRPIRPDELCLLDDFLYEAIFQRDRENRLPRTVIRQPELAVYIRDFGQSAHDRCLVAEKDGRAAGAVWTRILSGDVKGFGYLDAQTPEFAVSLYPEYRGQGIGTALMSAMLRVLKQAGYPRASLAVQKDNYAVSMYQKAGFVTVRELEEEYLMVCDLERLAP